MKKKNMTRRTCISSMIALATLGLGNLTNMNCSGMKKTKSTLDLVGIQLYTLRDLMKDDFKGTIKKVADIGYDAVEFAGYGGLSAKEMALLLNDLGLKVAGTHEGFGNLEKDIDAIIDYQSEIGNKFIVCPSMPGEWREKGADGFREFGERLSKIGEKTSAAGIQLCYHNHSFEFKKEKGKYLIE